MASTNAWMSLRMVRASATVLAVLALAGAQAQAQAPRSIAIDNFAQVDANYFRGAQPGGHDYADLAALGIKSVINLTSDDADASEPSMVAGAGMQYFQIPMTTRTVPTPDQLQRFFQIVNDAKNQPVYVHCVGGSHRTGVMTAVYRIATQRWTVDRAFAEMKTFKFGPDFLHPEFKKFVLAYRADPLNTAAQAAAPLKPES
jgi:uncharacterized protein (TIGR01244 family)